MNASPLRHMYKDLERAYHGTFGQGSGTGQREEVQEGSDGGGQPDRCVAQEFQE